MPILFRWLPPAARDDTALASEVSRVLPPCPRLLPPPARAARHNTYAVPAAATYRHSSAEFLRAKNAAVTPGQAAAAAGTLRMSARELSPEQRRRPRRRARVFARGARGDAARRAAPEMRAILYRRILAPRFHRIDEPARNKPRQEYMACLRPPGDIERTGAIIIACHGQLVFTPAHKTAAAAAPCASRARYVAQRALPFSTPRH